MHGAMRRKRGPAARLSFLSLSIGNLALGGLVNTARLLCPVNVNGILDKISKQNRTFLTSGGLAMRCSILL